MLLFKHTLFFSSFCFCLSSKAARRFSALVRCCSSFRRRSSSCCSLSCRAFSSFSSHWFFLAAKIGQMMRSGQKEEHCLPVLLFYCNLSQRSNSSDVLHVYEATLEKETMPFASSLFYEFGKTKFNCSSLPLNAA